MELAHEIIEAAKGGDLPRLSRLLDIEPALVDARDERGLSPVLAAIYAGKKEAVRFLLTRGAELDLYESCAAGALERVKAILGADPDAVESWSHDGFTPLHLASFFGHMGTAEFLVSAGADVRAVSENEMRVTPLHSASAGNHGKIVRLLIEHGADVRAVQQGSCTALHSAASNGNEEIVRLLLDAGADRAARSDDGRTPFDLATARGHAGVARILSPAP